MERVTRAETLQTRANRSAGAIGQRAEKELRWLEKQRNFGGRAMWLARIVIRISDTVRNATFLLFPFPYTLRKFSHSL